MLQWGHDVGVVEDAMIAGRRLDPVARSLQWGHDVGVVEDSRIVSRIDDRDVASMGPRRWSRGRRGSRRCHGRHAKRFNGATTLESWKTIGR